MRDLSKRIVEIILMSLGDGFERSCYEAEFSKCHGYLRIINYTPATPSGQVVEGLGMHTDMGCLTILYPEDISSLKVRSKQGQWMGIVPCEGSIVVNIGDMLEAWTNTKLRSSEHRVMLSKPRNRLSLAFFWSFKAEKVIFALEELVGEGKKRIFKPSVCLNYVNFREFDDKERYDKVGNTVRAFAGCEE